MCCCSHLAYLYNNMLTAWGQHSEADPRAISWQRLCCHYTSSHPGCERERWDGPDWPSAANYKADPKGPALLGVGVGGGV